jgi:hypothetical protein
MSLAKWLVIIVWFLAAAQPARADSLEKIVGTSKLVSQEIEIQATGEKAPALGTAGYVICRNGE